jgi:hypothetical protein
MNMARIFTNAFAASPLTQTLEPYLMASETGRTCQSTRYTHMFKMKELAKRIGNSSLIDEGNQELIKYEKR